MTAYKTNILRNKIAALVYVIAPIILGGCAFNKYNDSYSIKLDSKVNCTDKTRLFKSYHNPSATYDPSQNPKGWIYRYKDIYTNNRFVCHFRRVGSGKLCLLYRIEVNLEQQKAFSPEQVKILKHICYVFDDDKTRKQVSDFICSTIARHVRRHSKANRIFFNINATNVELQIVITGIAKPKQLLMRDENSRRLMFRGYNKTVAILEQDSEKAEKIKNAADEYMLSQAIRNSPTNAEAHCNRAGHFRSIGMYKEAVPDYDNALKYYHNASYAFPEAQLYGNRGVCYQQLGMLKKALGDYNKANELEKDWI